MPEKSVDSENTSESTDLSKESPEASSDQTESGLFRTSFGSASEVLSDSVNDNLGVARQVFQVSIGLLAAYGISQSPLFFRYRSISELSSHHFLRRQRLRCRLLKVDQRDQSGKSVLHCHLRHLSPIEQVLPLSWYNQLMSLHPATSVRGIRPDEREHIQIQLAGIDIPPEYLFYSSDTAREGLERMAKRRMRVSCQLFASVAPVDPEDTVVVTRRSIDSIKPVQTTGDLAVGKISFRQSGHFFGTDMATHLVRSGQATASSEFYGVEDGFTIHHASQDVNDLKRDAQYLDSLAKAELDAAKGKHGMWINKEAQREYSETSDEANFQTQAPWHQKLFRWLRGG